MSSNDLNKIDASQKVYVGNLPRQATSEDLTTHFEQLGAPLIARVLRPGLGCVAYATADEVAGAISAFDGSEVGGSNIECLQWAAKNPDGPGDDGGGVTKRFLLRDLPENTTEAHLRDTFGQLGEIEEVTVKQLNNGAFTGSVKFANPTEELRQKMLREKHEVNGEKVKASTHKMEKLARPGGFNDGKGNRKGKGAGKGCGKGGKGWDSWGGQDMMAIMRGAMHLASQWKGSGKGWDQGWDQGWGNGWDGWGDDMAAKRRRMDGW
uniref:RRM domain-containing protein n=1 Tax=Zooxanthella nutricula TaxID=1333877 RepID=A0A7S2VKP4_9DINO